MIARDSPSLALAQVHPVTASEMHENSRVGLQRRTFFVCVGSHGVAGRHGTPWNASICGQLLRSGVVSMSELAGLLCRQAYAITARIPGD